MHWFWRGSIAFAAGFITGVATFYFLSISRWLASIHHYVYYYGGLFWYGRWQAEIYAAGFMLYFIAPVLVSLIVYHYLSHRVNGADEKKGAYSGPSTQPLFSEGLKRRHHERGWTYTFAWLLRGLTTFLVAGLVCFVLSYQDFVVGRWFAAVHDAIYSSARNSFPRTRLLRSFMIAIAPNLSYFIPVGLTALVVYGLLGRRSFRLPDSCGSCGYNLTGNTSGICPECGERI